MSHAVHVTWGVDPSDADKLRRNIVRLPAADIGAAPISDMVRVRRTLAAEHLSGPAAAPFVKVYEIAWLP